jgi:hypothetical protein
MFKPFLLCISILSLTHTFAQKNASLQLGPSKINLEIFEYKTDTLLFINLHNDEKTSIEAVKQVLPEKYGKYMGLLSGGTRELCYQENSQVVKFDPNRIFTKTGIEKTLQKYQSYSEKRVKSVEQFASDLLALIKGAKLLVAVHNNSNGGFSVNSIKNEMDSKKDALNIYINPSMDEDDFYYVTEKEKFLYFKKKGYNVVLQDNVNVEDDGSLSVYCGRHKISYINVECQAGHLDQQIKMITEIYLGIADKWL